jgi:hypothetical protein
VPTRSPATVGAASTIFEVVEQEQQPLAADVRDESVVGADRSSRWCVRRVRGIPDRLERNPEDAVGELLRRVGREMASQARLARAARPGQRHQPVRAQKRTRLVRARALGRRAGSARSEASSGTASWSGGNVPVSELVRGRSAALRSFRRWLAQVGPAGRFRRAAEPVRLRHDLTTVARAHHPRRRWTSTPTYPSSVNIGSARVCSPIRTRTGPLPGPLAPPPRLPPRRTHA